MEFMECVQTRRSIRRFTAQKIQRAVWERIVQAASCAPSWKNSQVIRYIVIEDPALLQDIRENCIMDHPGNRATLESAAALVLVTIVNGRVGYERDGSFTTSKGDRWESFDAGIATQTFCLAAWEEGLGTVIMGIFDDAKVAAAAGVPEGQTVAALVAAGYPAEIPAMPKRKSVEELLSFLD